MYKEFVKQIIAETLVHVKFTIYKELEEQVITETLIHVKSINNIT